jgi:predicted acylesterase/phospholipase RssA
MDVRKIALILAGGVSLGSYEAGVLTELLYALDTLNATAEAEGRPRYKLDVMTGGSAGGMTAVLVARIMMYDLPGRRHHLYNAWVRDVGIIRLLDRDDMPRNALLSKKVIQEIAQRYVVDGADQAPTQPASFAPERLALSLSLSNMHGISYQIPYYSSTDERRQFVTTFFSDMARFELRRAALPGSSTWAEMAEAAIACGNFPLAFKPHPVRRMGSDYPGSLLEDDTAFFQTPLSFIDGGLFNNEPLREAIEQAAVADDGSIDPERIFILVDPHINTSLHARVVDPDGKLQDHVRRIFTMIRGESTARDWLRANRTNTEIAWRDRLIHDLARVLDEATLPNEQALVHEFKDLSTSIVERKRALFGAERYPDGYLERCIDQTLAQEPFEALHAGLAANGQPSPKQELFRYLAFVLNNVAGLQNKRELRLALIGSNKEETAGDQLYAFGGFFDEAWRTYDYRLGREKAHALLPDILGLPASYPEEQDATGAPHQDYHIPQDWRDTFPHVTIRDAHPNLRKELRNVVLDRASHVLKEAGVPGLFRWGIRKFYLTKKLNEQLSL